MSHNLFWSKVSIQGPDECWEWKGALLHNGYGGFNGKRSGLPNRAHRASWVIHHGPIPNELHVLHVCDNRKCVNPNHLFLGNRQDNMRDMVSKGRQAHSTLKGVEIGNHKLTPQEVVMIRKDSRPLKLIAQEYGVSYVQIRNIRKRKHWRHLP